MHEYPFHLSVKIISRSKGHNALAAAAYRAGERLVEGSGDKAITHDYRRRSGVMSSFIMAPRDAPAWATNRQKLWSKVEKSEKRVDAQIAREIIVSLPAIDIYDHLNERNKARRLRQFYERLLRNYANDNFVKEGMIADIALHAPSKKNDERNYHAHIMLSMRKVVSSEVEFGAKARDWNSPVRLENWRRRWGSFVNTTLNNHKVAAFIDHRTYAERGLEIGATKPIGADNYRQEMRGIRTIAGNDNRKIVFDNISDHKYLEKLFEHSPMASQSDILSAIRRSGYEDADAVLEWLEKSGMLGRLTSLETGNASGILVNIDMKKRGDNLKRLSKALYERSSYDINVNIVKNTVNARGDKKIREALNYS